MSGSEKLAQNPSPDPPSAPVVNIGKAGREALGSQGPPSEGFYNSDVQEPGSGPTVANCPADTELEHRRLSITPESIRIFKSIRERLSKLQQSKPWVQGVGFYGSRIRGQERPDSDVDLIVYGTPNFDYFNRIQEEDVHQLVEPSGAHVELHPFVPEYGEFADAQYFVDISPHALRKGIQSLIEHIDNASWSSRSHPEGDLATLFYFAVGDGVYKARKYVLDQLATLPEGDAVMALISEELNEHERTDKRPDKPQNPLYAHFPKTVGEARTYFVNKEYAAFEYPGLSNREYRDAANDAWDAAARARELARKPRAQGIRELAGRLMMRG